MPRANDPPRDRQTPSQFVLCWLFVQATLLLLAHRSCSSALSFPLPSGLTPLHIGISEDFWVLNHVLLHHSTPPLTCSICRRHPSEQWSSSCHPSPRAGGSAGQNKEQGDSRVPALPYCARCLVNLGDTFDQPPLFFCRSREAFTQLLSRGANLFRISTQGQTVLHAFVYNYARNKSMCEQKHTRSKDVTSGVPSVCPYCSGRTHVERRVFSVGQKETIPYHGGHTDQPSRERGQAFDSTGRTKFGAWLGLMSSPTQTDEGLWLCQELLRGIEAEIADAKNDTVCRPRVVTPTNFSKPVPRGDSDLDNTQPASARKHIRQICSNETAHFRPHPGDDSSHNVVVDERDSESSGGDTPGMPSPTGEARRRTAHSEVSEAKQYRIVTAGIVSDDGPARAQSQVAFKHPPEAPTDGRENAVTPPSSTYDDARRSDLPKTSCDKSPRSAGLVENKLRRIRPRSVEDFINWQDHRGWTALHVAAFLGHIPVCKVSPQTGTPGKREIKWNRNRQTRLPHMYRYINLASAAVTHTACP